MKLNEVYTFLWGTLRGRLILGVALVHAVMMTLFIIDLTARQRALLLDRQQEEAAALAQSLATASADWLAAADLAGLQELVEAQRRYPELVFAILTDERGQILAHTDPDRRKQFLLDLPGAPGLTLFRKTPALVDIAVPAVLGGHQVGWARVGLAQRATQKKLAAMLWDGALYAVAAIVIGSLIAWRMGSRITRRLYAVQQTIAKVGRGERQARAALTGTDEAAAIAAEFDELLDTLEEQRSAQERSESKYRLLLRNLGAGVVVHGPDTGILLANPVAQELLGLSEAQLLGKSAQDPAWHFLREDGSVMPPAEYPVNRVLTEERPLRDLVAGVQPPHGKAVVWLLIRAEATHDAQGAVAEVVVTFVDITGRKQAEEALRQSEAELNAFFSQAIDGCFFMMLDTPVVWDEHTDKERTLDQVFSSQRITRINDAMLAQYGATREEMLGLTPNDFFAHNPTHGRELWRRFFDAGTLHLESDERKRDGTPIWIEGEYIALYDREGRITGHFGLQRDITARKQTETALLASRELLTSREAELNEAQRLARIGCWDWDAVRDSIWWSAEYYRIYGIDPSQPPLDYQKHVLAYTSESAARLDAAVQKSMTTGEPYEVTLELAQPTATTRWIVARGETKRDADGKICGLRGTAQDITEQKNTEARITALNLELENRVARRTEALQGKSTELQDSQLALMNIVEDLNEKTQELEQANQALQGLDRLKSMFVASMSHELRTPLNSIIGFSSVLLDEWLGPLNEEQKAKLAIVLRTGKHLLTLINDVIDVSKIEAGNLESRIEDFELQEVVTEALELVHKEGEEKGLRFHDITRAQCLHSDRRRFFQCLVNLLSNAVKFSHQGEVTVISELVAGIGTQPDCLRLSVRDCGIGIPLSEQPRLFTAFSRIHSELSGTIKGTGLGLYLVKKITEEILKGHVAVSSTPGQGSIFSLTVPLRIAEPPPAIPNNLQPPPESRTAINP